MPSYTYLIIGGGMTADAAVKGIRAVDPAGSIGMISAEPHPPYKRPPLSKALWKGEPVESIWLKTPEDGVTFHTSRTAARLDPAAHTVTDTQGTEYTYTKLLLATGGKVRHFFFPAEGVIYYRTFDDFQMLKQRAGKGKSALVVGSGFIGSEIAAALTMNGARVTLVSPEPGIGSRIFPRRLSDFITSYYTSKGVTLCMGRTVKGIRRMGDRALVTVSDGRDVRADVVVAGLGIEPDVELARKAGIPVENGITVDQYLQAGAPDVYAAGDVANFHNPALGKRLRVEHEDNATAMGEAAGRNMAAAPTPYTHLPMFYSDLFDLGYEAVGELDARLETVEDWKEEFKEGVVYYLAGGRVRGALLWNVWGKVDEARALIAEEGPFTAESVKGKL